MVQYSVLIENLIQVEARGKLLRVFKNLVLQYASIMPEPGKYFHTFAL